MSQQASIASMAAAFAGMRQGAFCMSRTYVNDLGYARQVNTVQIVVADSTAYTFTINGYTITFTSGVGATAAQIRDGLIANAMTVQDLEGICSFGVSGSDIKITAKVPGTGFTYADSDSNLATTAVTANGTPETVPFGRALVKGANGDKSARLPSTSGQTFIGVAERIHSGVSPTSAGEAYDYFSDMSVLFRGEIWVETEEAIAVGDSAYFRHTSGAGGSVVGKFRNDSDTSSCTDSGYKFITSTTGAGLARIALNLA